MSSIEKIIQEKAYQLWERAGRPGGRDHEFWYAAVQELETEPAPVEKAAAGNGPTVAHKDARANGGSSSRRRRSGKAG